MATGTLPGARFARVFLQIWLAHVPRDLQGMGYGLGRPWSVVVAVTWPTNITGKLATFQQCFLSLLGNSLRNIAKW